MKSVDGEAIATPVKGGDLDGDLGLKTKYNGRKLKPKAIIAKNSKVGNMNYNPNIESLNKINSCLGKKNI